MSVSKMIGKVLVSAKLVDNDRVEFVDADGVEYSLFHDQDCCESVYVEDVIGDLQWLVGAPLYMAEEVYSHNEDPDEVKREITEYSPESWTWTFYKFATVHGYVTIRFYGSSNGYYGESARLHINGEAQYD